MSFFQLGPNTMKIPFQMHADNRKKLLARFKTAEVPASAIILVRGGSEKSIEDTDIEYGFKQESFFQYLFGVAEPGFMGSIDMNGKATLYMPRMDPSWQVWMGKIKPPTYFQTRYEVDEVKYADEVPSHMTETLKPEVIYVLDGVNTDSGLRAPQATFEGIEKFKVDKVKLHKDLVECRVYKSPAEIEALRNASRLSALAHMEVMRLVKPGMMEYQLEASFLYHMYYNGGARYSGYGSIVGSGPNSAILHYGHAGAPNDRQIKDGDLVLLDMGGEYHCYDGDLTSTFPANGKFTADQRDIYETVYAMQKGVEAAMKPGVMWPDMHRLSYRIMCEEMKKRGFFKGEVDDMLKAHIPALLMPHGLGHLIGLDTHDVGGYPEGTSRIQEPGICKLRCGRPLAPGMCLTVEPGIYFNSFLLEPAFKDAEKAKFLNEEKIRKFFDFGGIRLEDDVAITETGADILNDPFPRSIAEIEAFMAAEKK